MRFKLVFGKKIKIFRRNLGQRDNFRKNTLSVKNFFLPKNGDIVPKSQYRVYEPIIMTHWSVINICMLYQKKIRQGEVLGVYV